MRNQKNLMKAYKNKNDEFYTPLKTIENELDHYKKYFKDKVIYCNCDNFKYSNFFKYFVNNFNKFKIKRLISSYYVENKELKEKQLSLLNIDKENKKEKAKYIIINEVENDKYNLDDLIKNKNNIIKEFKENGDFRSLECLELLKESDIIITNPPFSLFREYMDVLVEQEKKFIILGSHIATNYKNMSEYIMKDKLWIGYNYHNNVKFLTDTNEYKEVGIGWFTNLDVENRHKKIELNCEYDEKKYEKYDGLDIIEVPRVELIPKDYDGIMGIPSTFISKYNPEQFEILGWDRQYIPKNKMYKGCLTINGKMKYTRILIKLRKEKI